MSRLTCGASVSCGLFEQQSRSLCGRDNPKPNLAQADTRASKYTPCCASCQRQCTKLRALGGREWLGLLWVFFSVNKMQCERSPLRPEAVRNLFLQWTLYKCVRDSALCQGFKESHTLCDHIPSRLCSVQINRLRAQSQSLNFTLEWRKVARAFKKNAFGIMLTSPGKFSIDNWESCKKKGRITHASFWELMTAVLKIFFFLPF